MKVDESADGYRLQLNFFFPGVGGGRSADEPIGPLSQGKPSGP